MNQTDLSFTSALDQARLIRRREVTPLQLVELYLERIERLSRLGSYFTVADQQALADAKAKTELVQSSVHRNSIPVPAMTAQSRSNSSGDLPAFFGVPIAIKDLNAVAGMPCTYGVQALKTNTPTADDGVVTRIKQAGFIVLGKTATSELGSLPYTEPPGFPPTRNPWNLDYTPGGSSGGAAAAVAAGLCPIAQGSDGGGSLRGPAACCGLVGIKPLRGRVSHAPVGDRQNGISSDGPLAHTVADAAALLDVMSGYIVGDPYWLPEPEVSFLEATRQSPGRLRVAFSTVVAPVGEATQSIEETVKLLEAMGHQVEPGCPDFTELVEPFKKVWQAGVAAAGVPLEAISPLNRWVAQQAGSAGDYLQAVAKMQAVSRQIVRFFDHFDVLVLPTYMHCPIRIGQWSELSPEETIEKIIRWIAPCPPFNAAGLPAIALPTGFDANGLPMSVQLVGRPAAEATLISLAAQIEAAQPWSAHRPAFATKERGKII